MMIGWAWSAGIYNEFGLLTLIEKFGFQTVTLIE
jgi:hypothetical protein